MGQAIITEAAEIASQQSVRRRKQTIVRSYFTGLEADLRRGFRRPLPGRA